MISQTFQAAVFYFKIQEHRFTEADGSNYNNSEEAEKKGF